MTFASRRNPASRTTRFSLMAAVVFASWPLHWGQSAAAQQLGPVPTSTSTTVDGPFAIATIRVATAQTPKSIGGVTVWYPTSTAQTYGAIAMVPGWLFGRNYLDWYGRRLASHGFVVVSVDPNSVFDGPDDRGIVLLAALNWLVDTSAVKSRVDAKRLGVLGHSMGGGGVLEAATIRQDLRAGMALQPWNGVKTFRTTVPIAILGGESDTSAAPAKHAEPMYAGMTRNEKAYLELNNAGHLVPASDNPTISRFVLSWAKRWIDGDTRYSKFLCPGPTADQKTVEEYRSTCPF